MSPFPYIRLHPFNPIDPMLLSELAAGIAERFGDGVLIGEDLPVPRDAYSERRQQFLSTRLLRSLEELSHAEPAIRLGVTDLDLYVPELNFVFGEASPEAEAAVFSIVRLDPRSYGEPENHDLLLQRALTEATHELGHIFGLGHCSRRDCVMGFSNTLSETDRKGSRFCERCALLLPERLPRAA